MKEMKVFILAVYRIAKAKTIVLLVSPSSGVRKTMLVDCFRFQKKTLTSKCAERNVNENLTPAAHQAGYTAL